MTEPATPPTIRLELRDHAAWITLDRPPLNVLDVATNRAFAAAVRSLAGRREARVVVVTGAGSRAFSAGVEIDDHTKERAAEMLGSFHDVFRAFTELGRPVVAAVRGAALGGGCELVAFADVAIAAESATFGFPEIRLGCFPPVAAVVLPGVVGAKRAAELVLGGRTIAANEAKAIGLVNRVVPDERFEANVGIFLEDFTEWSGVSLGLAREALRPAGQAFLDDLARAEALYVDKLLATEDAHEGIAAWKAKRSPNWKDA